MSLRQLGGKHKDLSDIIAANTQPGGSDFDNAGLAGLDHSKSAAVANAEFSHADNPRRIAVNIDHVSPYAGMNHVERNRKYGIHAVGRQVLLRFSLNKIIWRRDIVKGEARPNWSFCR